MAKRVAAQETARAGPLQTNAEIDARVYGKFFPCDIAVVAMEFKHSALSKCA
jgi:hypothetical protein